MLNACFLIFLVIPSAIFAQNNTIDDAVDSVFGNGTFLKGYEIVTKAPLQSLGPVEKCGEGADEGVHRCVPYHDCDPINNVINEIDVDLPQNGSGLINIRAGSNSCDHYLDVCCRITQPQQTTVRTTQLPIRRTNSLPLRNQTNSQLISTVSPPNQGRRNQPNVSSTTVSPNQNRRNQANNSNQGSRVANQPCGIRNSKGIDFKITGNTNDEAEYGEFPWIVALLEKNANQTQRFSFCGGSLITSNVVLTAAHCVFKYSANQIKIRAGEWDAQTEKERLPYQERDVSQILLHPDFAKDVLYNDIALLVLVNRVELAENVGTICLPKQNQDFQSQISCFAGGWGKDPFGDEGQYQMILKKVELPLVERSRCLDQLRTTRLGRRFVLHESFRCAGGEEGKDTCKGDGGSPLACPAAATGTERYIQTGIVAWGISCGYKDVPGVYTDVTKYRNWIDTQLDQLRIDKSSYII